MLLHNTCLKKKKKIKNQIQNFKMNFNDQYNTIYYNNNYTKCVIVIIKCVKIVFYLLFYICNLLIGI